MNKPKEIIELEKLYGIELIEVSLKNYEYGYRNSYVINNRKRVTHLNLSGNEFDKSIDFGNFKYLQELNLSHNKFTEIKGCEALIYLNKLYISDNQIDMCVANNVNRDIIHIDPKHHQLFYEGDTIQKPQEILELEKKLWKKIEGCK